MFSTTPARTSPASIRAASTGSTDGRSRFLIISLLGFGRHSRELDANWRPVAPAEIEAALRAYEAFVSS